MTTKFDGLISKIHEDFEKLFSVYQKLLTKGFAAVDLPEVSQLQAICVLGNHGRDEVVAELIDIWSELENRNLVEHDIPISKVSTSLLRLMVHARNSLSDIPTITERLNSVASPALPTSQLLNIAEVVDHVYWGQRVILSFKCKGAEALQVSSDAIFGLEPAILRACQDGSLVGNIEFYADDGSFEFTVLSVTGDVFRKIVHVNTYQNPEEFYG